MESQGIFSQEDLEAQAGFADLDGDTTVIHIRSDQTDETRKRLPLTLQSTAHGREISQTVLRMIEIFPGQSCSMMPFDWAETSLPMLTEVTRRLVAMDLLRRHHNGLAGPSDRLFNRPEEIANQKEHQALYDLRKLMENVSEGISEEIANQKELFKRPEETANQKKHQALHGLRKLMEWLGFGLEFFCLAAGGLVALSRIACLRVLDAVATLEKLINLDSSDDPKAYDLDHSAFSAVQVHLATAFFERLSQVISEPERQNEAFHLVAHVIMNEDTERSVMPLAPRLARLPEAQSRGQDRRPPPVSLLVYKDSSKTEGAGYRFWGPTLVYMRHFEEVFGGDVLDGLCSMLAAD